MIISQGDVCVFFTRPLAGTLMALAFAALVAPQLYRLWKKR